MDKNKTGAAAIQFVKLRHAFYKDSYKRVVFVLLLSIIANAILVSVLFYIYTHPPKPKYFATNISGRIIPLFPLDKANQADSSVLQWANEAAMAAYSYDWVHYRQELQAASEFFTPFGWRQFTKELVDSNNLNTVLAKRMVVSATALRAPAILKQGVAGGRYYWRIRIPIQITFQGEREFSQSKLLIFLTIQRISTLNQPRGIGIIQFIAESLKG